MKFRYYLETISGIEVYPMISLFIFVTFFAVVTYMVFRTSKEEVDRMGNIPLDNPNKL